MSGKASGAGRPRHGRRADRAMWITIAVFTTMALFYIAVLSAARVYYAPTAPPLSTYGTDPGGMAALYRYLAASGVQVARLEQFDDLPQPGDSVIVESGALLRRPTGERVRRLEDWVSSGGLLLLVSDTPNPFHQMSGTQPYGAARETKVIASPEQPTRKTRGVRTVSLAAGTALSPVPADAVVSMSTSEGPSLLSRRVGRGTVVVLADQHAFSNAGIRERDNLALALSMLLSGGRRTVHFDEYHHGYASSGGAWGALPPSVRISLAGLVLATAVFLYARGRRFGPPVAVVAEPPRSPLEYVESLAGLFERAGAIGPSAGILVKGFERELVRRFGAIARDRAAAREHFREQGLVRTAEALARAEAEVEDERAFLALAKAVSTARQEVTRADSRRRGAR